MALTKAELEERAARLEADNERLRGQLATAGAGQRIAQATPRTPWLSEGERQELEAYGAAVSPFTGQRVTADEAREAYPDVEIREAKPGAVRAAGPAPRRTAQPREGVDFVYPSVAPGQLADDVARPVDAPAVPVDAPAAPVDGDE